MRWHGSREGSPHGGAHSSPLRCASQTMNANTSSAAEDVTTSGLSEAQTSVRHQQRGGRHQGVSNPMGRGGVTLGLTLQALTSQGVGDSLTPMGKERETPRETRGVSYGLSMPVELPPLSFRYGSPVLLGWTSPTAIAPLFLRYGSLGRPLPGYQHQLQGPQHVFHGWPVARG